MAQGLSPESSLPAEDSTSETPSDDHISRHKNAPKSFGKLLWLFVTGKHVHIRDWLIAGFTAALTVATVFYVHYAKQQRDAMFQAVNESRKANSLTEEALGEANRARMDSERTANEMIGRAERAAKAAETSALAMTEQAAASRAVAQATRQSVDIGEQGARAYIDIRSIKIDALAPGKRIVVSLLWSNNGNSPAEITGWTKLGKATTLQAPLDRSEVSPNIRALVVPPHDTRVQKHIIGKNLFDSGEIQALLEDPPTLYLTFYGSVVYKTAGKEFPFHFCTYYAPGHLPGKDFLELECDQVKSGNE